MTARSITGVLVAAAMTAATAGALAQGAAEKKPALLKPASEMSQLKFFDGSWSCSGEMMPAPGAPAVKTRSSVKSHSDLSGFWQSGIVKSSAVGMPPFEGMFHMTYDTAGKQFLMLWVDNMGGWSQETSPGWEGDKIVFTGEGVMNGQKMGARDTFTRNADGSLKHVPELQSGGNWMPAGEETCKKAAPAPAKK